MRIYVSYMLEKWKAVKLGEWSHLQDRRLQQTSLPGDTVDLTAKSPPPRRGYHVSLRLLCNHICSITRLSEAEHKFPTSSIFTLLNIVIFSHFDLITYLITSTKTSCCWCCKFLIALFPKLQLHGILLSCHH